MSAKYFFFISLIISFSACSIKPSTSHQTDWDSLLINNDLSNFQVLNGNAEYFVKDQIIVGVSTPNSPNTFLSTKKHYDDFILEFEVWADPALNSGVQFRSNSSPNIMDGKVHGYQVEIESSDRKWAGGIYEEGRRGWLYPLDKNPKAQDAFRVNEWNHYRIEAIGDELITWVNKQQCTHLKDNQTDSGFIGFQIHSIADDSLANKQVKWRNIRIRTTRLNEEKWTNSENVPLVNTSESN